MRSPLHSTRPHERAAGGDSMAGPTERNGVHRTTMQSPLHSTRPHERAAGGDCMAGLDPASDHAKLPCGHLSTQPGLTRGQLVATAWQVWTRRVIMQSYHAVTSPLNQASREGSWWRFTWQVCMDHNQGPPAPGVGNRATEAPPTHWPKSKGHCGREARGCGWLTTSTSCQRGLTDVKWVCPSEHHGRPYGPRKAVPGSGRRCLARPGSYSPPGGLLVNTWGNTWGVHPARISWQPLPEGQNFTCLGSSLASWLEANAERPLAVE